MAYIDRTTGGNQRIATIAVVVAIQGAAMIALINGLAVTWTPPDIVPNPKATDVPITMPIDPLPPPPERPVDDHQTVIDNPIRPIPVPPRDANEFPVTPPAPEAFPTARGEPPPPPLPQPTPTFTPRTARPSNLPGTWATPNDYPARDLREGNQGQTSFMLAVGADGRVQSCTVTRSSGHPGLDKATCDNVARRARFEPATDGAGNRVAGTFTSTIVWRIPRD
jgi:protein TonB